MSDDAKSNDFNRNARIIYSNRSETSVEDLMEITPSAFNKENGRIENE